MRVGTALTETRARTPTRGPDTTILSRYLPLPWGRSERVPREDGRGPTSYTAVTDPWTRPSCGSYTMSLSWTHWSSYVGVKTGPPGDSPTRGQGWNRGWGPQDSDFRPSSVYSWPCLRPSCSRFIDGGPASRTHRKREWGLRVGTRGRDKEDSWDRGR